MKLLAWAILIFAVIWVLRSKAKAQQKARQEAASPPPPPSQPALPEAEVMIACAHCGVHFPSSEAVRDASDAAFCCDEHRRQHTGTRV